MKALNKATQKVLDRIVEGMTPGSHKKYDADPKAYMALYVNRLTANLFSIAHNYEKNGDLIPDPDLELWRDEDGKFYPVALQQNTGHYTRAIDFGSDGKPARYNPSAQAELASFTTMWVRNIREQQGL